jgi:hypothetical protein
VSCPTTVVGRGSSVVGRSVGFVFVVVSEVERSSDQVIKRSGDSDTSITSRRGKMPKHTTPVNKLIPSRRKHPSNFRRRRDNPGRWVQSSCPCKEKPLGVNTEQGQEREGGCELLGCGDFGGGTWVLFSWEKSRGGGKRQGTGNAAKNKLTRKKILGLSGKRT